MACWIIGYGIVQSVAPYITGKKQGQLPDGHSAVLWSSILATIPFIIALALEFDFYSQSILIGGLLCFGAVFAVNSSLHSYLIVSYASDNGVSLDVGFYYMANAMGRLIGTLLSGWIYQTYGLVACLYISCIFIIITAVISVKLPKLMPTA